MDEDEFMRFISGPGSYCPYFDPYDEYKIVSRQNCEKSRGKCEKVQKILF